MGGKWEPENRWVSQQLDGIDVLFFVGPENLKPDLLSMC